MKLAYVVPIVVTIIALVAFIVPDVTMQGFVADPGGQAQFSIIHIVSADTVLDEAAITAVYKTYWGALLGIPESAMATAVMGNAPYSGTVCNYGGSISCMNSYVVPSTSISLK